MLFGDVSPAKEVMGVEDGIIEKGLQALGPESVHIFADNVSFEGAVHDIVICCLCVPDAETAVMFGGETSVGHMGGFCGAGPLVTVQLCGIEGSGGGVRVGPVCVHEGGDIEMDEHAEAQVLKFLLEGVEAAGVGVSDLGGDGG